MRGAGTLLSLIVLAAAGAPASGVVTRSMNMAEFLDLRRLSDAALRERYSLPASCNPSVSAVRRTADKFQVTIMCSKDAPAGRRPPARSGGERR